MRQIIMVGLAVLGGIPLGRAEEARLSVSSNAVLERVEQGDVKSLRINWSGPVLIIDGDTRTPTGTEASSCVFLPNYRSYEAGSPNLPLLPFGAEIKNVVVSSEQSSRETDDPSIRIHAFSRRNIPLEYELDPGLRPVRRINSASLRLAVMANFHSNQIRSHPDFGILLKNPADPTKTINFRGLAGAYPQLVVDRAIPGEGNGCKHDDRIPATICYRNTEFIVPLPKQCEGGGVNCCWSSQNLLSRLGFVRPCSSLETPDGYRFFIYRELGSGGTTHLFSNFPVYRQNSKDHKYFSGGFATEETDALPGTLVVWYQTEKSSCNRTADLLAFEFKE